MCCLAVLFTACDDIFASEDNPTPAYLSMSEAPVTLKAGDTYRRKAISVTTAVVEYTSSDTKVATVDGEGMVTAIAEGAATITATATGYSTGGKKIYQPASVSYNVKVVPATVAVTSITLDQTTLNKKVGDAAVTLTATVKPDDATDKTLTWSSDKPAVATVADGVVTFVGAGTAIITAEAKDGSGIKTTCTVNVLPAGALAGVFSVSATKKVWFSQGNLQYTKSTGIWSFMDHQWSFVENDGVVGADYSSQDVVSLFGWGTSGYDHGATSYLPYSTASDYFKYYAYGNSSKNLYDAKDDDSMRGQADWGYNKISNGGNSANTGWRTLTGGDDGEWNYLFNTRTTTSGIRFAKAKVNNVNGVILLPDDWDASYYALTSTNTTNADYTTNEITLADWTDKLEAHGAVFLPAAGRRSGMSVSGALTYGRYWSSTASGDTYVKYLFIYSTSLNPVASYARYYGLSVRLVYDVK